ncbi:MAG: hypothetical protein LC772_02380 [Chloroflexi bacterium]|nr:hypothetical protein [Chloroflexota bacterium]
MFRADKETPIGAGAVMKNFEQLARDYLDWPADAAARQAIAQEIFGAILIADHDYWLKTAHNLIVGLQPEQIGFIDTEALTAVLGTLPERDRVNLFDALQATVNGVIFGLLNNLDGTSGSALRGAHRDRLILLYNIYTADDFGEGREDNPVESIRINVPEVRELHELWLEWLERFSDYTEPPPRSLKSKPKGDGNHNPQR